MRVYQQGMDIRSAAEDHVLSYARAINPGQPADSSAPSVTTATIASSITDHYLLPGFVAFAFGTSSTFSSRKETIDMTQQHLDRYVKSGLGLDIRLGSYEIKTVSEGSAVCWMAWTVHPPSETVDASGDRDSGASVWTFRNLYCFRIRPDDERGYWEFAISDNEVKALLEKVPNFFELELDS